MTAKRLDFHIRLAENNDYEQIFKIWLEGISSSFDVSNLDMVEIEMKFKDNFERRNGIFNFWVAIGNNTMEVIGWCSILPAFSHPLKQNSHAEVSTYIVKEMSKNGIGTQLMQFVFKEINDKEIEGIFGFANPKNTTSIKMCENAGMRICGQTSTRVILIKEFK